MCSRCRSCCRLKWMKDKGLLHQFHSCLFYFTEELNMNEHVMNGRSICFVTIGWDEIEGLSWMTACNIRDVNHRARSVYKVSLNQLHIWRGYRKLLCSMITLTLLLILLFCTKNLRHRFMTNWNNSGFLLANVNADAEGLNKHFSIKPREIVTVCLVQFWTGNRTIEVYVNRSKS